MRAPAIAGVAIVTAMLGLVVGALVGRSSSWSAPRDALPVHATGVESVPSARTWDPSSRRTNDDDAIRDRRASADLDTRHHDSDRGHSEREPTREELEDPSLTAGLAPHDDIDTLTRELASLKRENAELRDEHAELLGEPLPQPSDIEPRFSGPSLTASIGQAIGQAGVEGKVEHVDCSEYPCITFGRLAGDEEDMEEIERAAALSQYDADVLTLLFWATSADSSEAPGAKETGLFALAFYSQDDRANDGAALDRRIRARTVEYWNTDRPARPAAAALD
jgi:hypothetical protein